MSCYIKLHPLDAFLKARLGVIRFFLSQGKSSEEIATILSMHNEEVSSIIKSMREMCDNERYKAFHNGDFFYAPYVEKELDE